MCFLWQHENFLWYLPGTACLYSRPSPADLACLRNYLLHACRDWYCGCHSKDTAVGRDRTRYSFSSILVVRCMKQNKDAVRSLVLLLVTGVRADPKYSQSYYIICTYIHEDCYFWFVVEIFHFFSRYLVVSSRYVFFSVSITCGATHAGRILFDTKRKRENSRVWPFEVGDAAVRQVASMNDSYGLTIVNCVWPHYSQ